MAIQREWIEALFEKLDGKYPRLFKTSFSASGFYRTEDEAIENAIRQWAEELHQCIGEDIQYALRRLSEEHPEFPPSAPMFAKMCREERTRLYQERENKAATLRLNAPVKKVSEETIANTTKQIESMATTGRANTGWAVKLLLRIVKGDAVNYVAEHNALEALKATGKMDDIPFEYIAMNRTAYRYFRGMPKDQGGDVEVEI